MNDLQAAKNYGDALFAAAKDNNAVAQLLDESAELQKAMRDVPQFIHFIEAPNVSPEEKMQFADKVLADRFHRLMRNFVLMMIKRNRVFDLRGALERFQAAAEKDMGLQRGTVQTAVALDEQNRGRLQNALESYTDGKLVLNFIVEPKILGGVVFKAGDLLIDNSLRTQLDHIAERMLAAKVV